MPSKVRGNWLSCPAPTFTLNGESLEGIALPSACYSAFGTFARRLDVTSRNASQNGEDDFENLYQQAACIGCGICMIASAQPLWQAFRENCEEGIKQLNSEQASNGAANRSSNNRNVGMNSGNSRRPSLVAVPGLDEAALERIRVSILSTIVALCDAVVRGVQTIALDSIVSQLLDADIQLEDSEDTLYFAMSLLPNSTHALVHIPASVVDRPASSAKIILVPRKMWKAADFQDFARVVGTTGSGRLRLFRRNASGALQIAKVNCMQIPGRPMVLAVRMDQQPADKMEVFHRPDSSAADRCGRLCISHPQFASSGGVLQGLDVHSGLQVSMSGSYLADSIQTNHELRISNLPDSLLLWLRAACPSQAFLSTPQSHQYKGVGGQCISCLAFSEEGHAVTVSGFVPNETGRNFPSCRGMVCVVYGRRPRSVFSRKSTADAALEWNVATASLLEHIRAWISQAVVNREQESAAAAAAAEAYQMKSATNTENNEGQDLPPVSSQSEKKLTERTNPELESLQGQSQSSSSISGTHTSASECESNPVQRTGETGHTFNDKDMNASSRPLDGLNDHIARYLGDVADAKGVVESQSSKLASSENQISAQSSNTINAIQECTEGSSSGINSPIEDQFKNSNNVHAELLNHENPEPNVSEARLQEDMAASSGEPSSLLVPSQQEPRLAASDKIQATDSIHDRELSPNESPSRISVVNANSTADGTDLPVTPPVDNPNGAVRRVQMHSAKHPDILSSPIVKSKSDNDDFKNDLVASVDDIACSAPVTPQPSFQRHAKVSNSGGRSSYSEAGVDRMSQPEFENSKDPQFSPESSTSTPVTEDDANDFDTPSSPPSSNSNSGKKQAKGKKGKKGGGQKKKKRRF